MTEPLPYVVRLRMVMSEDEPPVVSEVRCLAYSPMDAVLQSMVQMFGMSGIADGDKCKVESVGPDLEAWRKMRAEERQGAKQ